MDRLANTLELLDGPLDDRRAVSANLRDLRRINRVMGGVDLSWRALAALVGDGAPAGRPSDGEPITLLDVGAGGVDIPVALIDRAGRSGWQLEVTAIDSRAEILSEAIATTPELVETPGLRLAVGDGRALADPDRSRHVVHASLVIHHLEPDDAVAFLREMARVGARGVIVNDLIRSRLNWIGAWLISHLLTRSRFTRYDAPLSVRRAYTLAELEALLVAAGLRPIARFRGRFGHRYAIAAVAGPRP